jgi:hypothetical protein
MTKEQRTFKQRIVRNIIMRAACFGDEYNSNGELLKEGFGDLQAILAIWERLEGKPKQQITGPARDLTHGHELSGPLGSANDFK